MLHKTQNPGKIVWLCLVVMLKGTSSAISFFESLCFTYADIWCKILSSHTFIASIKMLSKVSAVMCLFNKESNVFLCCLSVLGGIEWEVWNKLGFKVVGEHFLRMHMKIGYDLG